MASSVDGGPQAPTPPLETPAAPPEKLLCKFFGSAKGCTADCEFSHDKPNSVPPCQFKQRLGHCHRGDVCTFRHVPWASAEEALAFYASRKTEDVELSAKRYKQLHRSDKPPASEKKLTQEHVELPVEAEVLKEMQEETYGSTAMRMMEKMGYKAGSGLGKNETGNVKLVAACEALEHKSATAALGLGNFAGSARVSVAERAARLAEARAEKRQRVEGSAVTVHHLLDDDDTTDSDGEGTHTKAKDKQLWLGPKPLPALSISKPSFLERIQANSMPSEPLLTEISISSLSGASREDAEDVPATPAQSAKSAQPAQPPPAGGVAQGLRASPTPAPLAGPGGDDQDIYAGTLPLPRPAACGEGAQPRPGPLPPLHGGGRDKLSKAVPPPAYTGTGSQDTPAASAPLAPPSADEPATRARRAPGPRFLGGSQGMRFNPPERPPTGSQRVQATPPDVAHLRFCEQLLNDAYH